MDLYRGYLFYRALMVFLLAVETVAAVALSRRKVAARVALYGVAVYLLVLKLIECVQTGAPPTDFSAMAYFLFGVCVFVPLRPFKAIGAYFSILAAFLYVVTALAFPAQHVDSGLPEAVRYFALLHHNLLWFGGVILLLSYPMRKHDLIWMFGYMVVAALYAVVLAVAFDIGRSSVFFAVLNGSVIHYLVPGWDIPLWYYFLYYPAGIGIGVALFFVLYALNRKCRFVPTRTRSA